MNIDNYRRLSLRKTLIIGTILGILLPMLTFQYFQATSKFERNVELRVEAPIKQYADLLMQGIATAIWTADLNLAHELVKSVMANPDVVSIRVTDKHGVLVISDERTVNFNNTLLQEQRDIVYNDLLMGHLVVKLSTDRVRDDLKGELIQLGISLIAQVIISILFISILFENRLIRPLHMLKRELLRLARGEFEAPLSWSRQDEVGQLVEAIDCLRIDFAELIAERYRVEKSLRQSEERQALALFGADLGLWDWDIPNDHVVCDERLCAMIGRSVNDVPQNFNSWRSLLSPADVVTAQITLDAHLNGEAPYYESKFRMQHTDGHWVWIHARGKVVEYGEGHTPLRMSGTHMDITVRKKLEDELATQSQITAYMEEGAYLVRSSDQTIVYTNPAFEEMFGYEHNEMHGMHVSTVNAQINISTEKVVQNIVSELEANGVWRGEVHNIKKGGALFWCSTTVSRFYHPDYGEVWLSICADISERKSMDQKLSYQASHDHLTGLIGRVEFENRATRLLSTIITEKTKHAMCFLDLDQFKVINDTCGHPAGDELLRQLGKLLQGIIRKRDTLARLGGDEFGVLMEHCSLEQANRVAEDILKAVMSYKFVWGSNVFRIGVSIGLVAVTEATGDFSNLFRQADAACYMAKDLGRNRIHIYNPDDTELAVRHGEMQWVGRINEALDDNRFCLYAQPIVPLDDSNHTHYELLIRMLNEKGETVPPGAFLPSAERYDIIEKIDAWVVNHACLLLAENAEALETIDFFSINLSGPSLTNQYFLETIVRNFKDAGIPPEKICFEITETVAVSNMDSAIKFIGRLKKEGFRFALDDFGSGISSFGYLKKLPVDYLKIDGIFVKDIVDDPVDYAMVKSINEVGHLMNMETIAEFVENDEIKDMLKAIGVDYGQGYGLGKPEPLDKILQEYSFRKKRNR